MIKRWNSNERLWRAIFILANAGVFISLFFLVAWPLHAFFAARDAQILAQRATLARFTAIAAQGPAIERLMSQSGAGKKHTEFLPGANDGVVAADLQTLLKRMAQTAGARLRSVRSLPIKVDKNIKLIGAKMDMVGPIRAVYQTVNSIETATPYLFIVGAALKPSQQAAMRTTKRGLEPTIDAQLDIVGALQVERIR